MTIEEVIDKSNYLLNIQKEKLTSDIENLKSFVEEDTYMDFLDMVLEKLLSIRVADLSNSERQQIKYILQDLGVEIHD